MTPLSFSNTPGSFRLLRRTTYRLEWVYNVMGQGVPSTGEGSARPGTTFADHRRHWPLQPPQVLVPPLQESFSTSHCSYFLLRPARFPLPDTVTVRSSLTSHCLLWLSDCAAESWPHDSRRYSPQLPSLTHGFSLVVSDRPRCPCAVPLSLFAHGPLGYKVPLNSR